MQLEKVLDRFPELKRKDFSNASALDLAGLEYTQRHVRAEVLDRRTWTSVAVHLSLEEGEMYVDCECDKFARSTATHCPHICELLDQLQWSDFSWPAGPLRIYRDDARPTWKRLFSQVRELSGDERPSVDPATDDVFFVLDVGVAAAEGLLPVHVYHAALGRRGKKRKPRPRSPSQLLSDGGLPRSQLHALQLLDSLSNRSGGYYSFSSESATIDLRRGAQRPAVGAMGQTGRLFWTLAEPDDQEAWRPLKWSDTPWQAKVTVDCEQEGWRFDAQLRQGERNRPLSDAAVLLPSGLVVFHDEAGAVESLDDSAPWLLAIQRTGPFVVPEADTSDMLKMMYSDFGAADVIDLPQPLQYRSVPGVPAPRAQFGKPSRGSRQLPVTVEFVYDDQIARPQYGAIHHDRRELVTRDSEAEQRHMEALEQAGLENFDLEHAGRLQLHADRLPAAVAFLTAAGWQVEADGKLVRASSTINIAVQSGLDWFDLDGAFDFDGSEVSIPRVLSAMRRGDKYVKLDDGSHGLLPEEWLTKFAPVAQLGEADGDTIRFSMPQAVLLDAMLNAQDGVQVDAKFASYRKKLASFQGIEPGKARRNFRGTLRPYQEEGLGWLKFLRDFGLGGCLADDMGLGKTIQVLAMLQSERQRRLKSGERRLPSLIVAPRSLLFNWMEEAERFTPNLKVLEYFGLERETLREDLLDYDMVVTTYGIVRRDIEFFVEQNFHYVVLDEAQAIKNSSSQASKACRLLNGRHRLAMTGTPIENHLGELWSLFEFINPGMLGRNEAFMALARRAADDEEARQLIATGVRPYVLRRTKEEVLKDLPEKNENTLICEMGPVQRKAYDELREYYRKLLSKKVETQGLKRSKIHVLEALLRLRQCACHPQLLNPEESLPSAKLDAMMSQLESIIDEGHKALVFSQFTKLLAIVRDKLDEQGIAHEYLDGRTRKRKDRVKAFQNNPDCPVFLISLKAGGHGLNLTAADYVFILDPWWNPAVEAQAVDRAHRIGQEKPVFAYRLICKDTVEEKIVQLQQEKKKLADSIISADASLMQSLTADDLAMLLS